MGSFFIVRASEQRKFENEVNNCIREGYRVINCTVSATDPWGNREYHAFMEKVRPVPGDAALPGGEKIDS